jgi:hypothetical protein
VRIIFNKKKVANIPDKIIFAMEQNTSKPELETAIYIFKTSIQTQLEVQFLAMFLDQERRISSWNVDLDDWEKILRVESVGISPGEVKKILTNLNIQCKQL